MMIILLLQPLLYIYRACLKCTEVFLFFQYMNMKKVFIIALLHTLSIISLAQNSSLENQLSKKRVRLPNGWHLSPAGRSLPLGDLPLNIAVSRTKKYIAVTNNGQSIQSIQLIDPKKEKVLHNVIIPKSWYGLKFSSDKKFLYASGGN